MSFSSNPTVDFFQSCLSQLIPSDPNDVACSNDHRPFWSIEPADIDGTIKIRVTRSYGNLRMSIPGGNMKEKTSGEAHEVQHLVKWKRGRRKKTRRNLWKGVLLTVK